MEHRHVIAEGAGGRGVAGAWRNCDLLRGLPRSWASAGIRAALVVAAIPAD